MLVTGRARVAGLTYTWDPDVLGSLTRGLPDSYMDPFFIAATPDTLAGKLDELVSRGVSQIIVNPVPVVADQVEPVIMAVAEYLR